MRRVKTCCDEGFVAGVEAAVAGAHVDQAVGCAVIEVPVQVPKWNVLRGTAQQSVWIEEMRSNRKLHGTEPHLPGCRQLI